MQIFEVAFTNRLNDSIASGGTIGYWEYVHAFLPASYTRTHTHAHTVYTIHLTHANTHAHTHAHARALQPPVNCGFASVRLLPFGHATANSPTRATTGCRLLSYGTLEGSGLWCARSGRLTCSPTSVHACCASCTPNRCNYGIAPPFS